MQKPWYKRLDWPLILTYFAIYTIVQIVFKGLDTFPQLFVGIWLSMYASFGLIGRDRWVKPIPPAPKEPVYDKFDKRVW